MFVFIRLERFGICFKINKISYAGIVLIFTTLLRWEEKLVQRKYFIGCINISNYPQLCLDNIDVVPFYSFSLVKVVLEVLLLPSCPRHIGYCRHIRWSSNLRNFQHCSIFACIVNHQRYCRSWSSNNCLMNQWASHVLLPQTLHEYRHKEQQQQQQQHQWQYTRRVDLWSWVYFWCATLWTLWFPVPS